MSFSIDDFEIHLDESAIAGLAGHGGVHEALTILSLAGEASAKDHVAVVTGNLRRSITSEVFKGKNPFARVGTNVFYAIYQEIGTRFHAATPFLRPAMEAIRQLMRGAR